MKHSEPIRFLLGRAGSGKSTAVLARIADAIREKKRVYLIVPEQEAVLFDDRCARTLPKDAALYLEIVSFKRLSNLVGRTAGGLSYHYITKGGKSALMWSALRTLAPALRVYGGARADRAVPALLGAVSEMKRCAVSPADLMTAAETLSEDPECTHIADRARDLSLLTASYETLLHASYDDAEDELSHLAERLSETDFFRGSTVFVDSFFSLTPVENEVVCEAFRKADGVTVTFACLPDDGDAPHLSAPYGFFTAMRKCADRAGREYVIDTFTENRRASSAEISYLEKNLWDFTAPPMEAAHRADSVRVIEAADRYAEAEAVAKRITELVKGGAKYSDIAVIARRMDPLRGILDTALARNGIPYFLSARSDIDTRPAARMLLSALAVASGGFRREDVLLLAKTGLCGLTDDESDALEAYTETWHIRGARAFDTPWNMNPDGYVATVSKRGEKLLSLANGAREKIIPPLSRFVSVFESGTAAVPAISRALYELLCDYGVWDSLRTESNRLSKKDSRAAAECAQLWGILMDCLDTLARTLPEARADASTYAALLRQVLGAAHVSAIPGGVDEVTVGEAHLVRLGDIPHVIIVGAVEGEFPGVPTDDGFFTDTDRIRLEGAGIVLSGTSDDRMKEELFWFYRAVSLPHDTLTVFLPKSDGAGALVPSMGAERILSLLPHIEKEDFDALPIHEKIFSEASARAAVRRADEITKAALAAIGYDNGAVSSMPISAKGESVTEETARMLFPREVSLTQSRLDSYVLCRFGYYAKYVAKLDEPKEAQLTAVNVGTFVHRVFELFFERLGDRPLPLRSDELTALADEIVEKCVSEIVPGGENKGRAAYLFTRLKRCTMPMLRSLSAEFAQSKFRPVRFELPVGTGDPAGVPSMEIPLLDGRGVSLRGTVDRLDTWRDGENTYVRVVDYKTGAKKFSPEDVKIGLNVQLLLYLFSVLRAPKGEFRDSITGGTGEILPAGALYFSARPGENSSDIMLSAEDAARLAEGNVERSGILLADERVLSAQEADLQGKFIPVKKKKDGTFGGYAVTPAEIDALETEMRETIAGIALEMASGDARALPRDPAQIHGQNPCEYCKMKPVCRAEIGKEAL